MMIFKEAGGKRKLSIVCKLITDSIVQIFSLENKIEIKI